MKLELTMEQANVKNAAREFAEKEFSPKKGKKCNEEYEFPWELYGKAAKLGFSGVSLPQEYGGQGLGCLARA